MCMDKFEYANRVILGHCNLIPCIEVYACTLNRVYIDAGPPFQSFLVSSMSCTFYLLNVSSYLLCCIALIGSSIQLLYKLVSKLTLMVVVRYWVRKNGAPNIQYHLG